MGSNIIGSNEPGVGLLNPPPPPPLGIRHGETNANSSATAEIPKVETPIDAETHSDAPLSLRVWAAVGLVLSVVLPPVGLAISIVTAVLARRLEGCGKDFAAAGIVIGATLTLLIGLLTACAMLLVDGVGDLLNPILSE